RTSANSRGAPRESVKYPDRDEARFLVEREELAERVLGLAESLGELDLPRAERVEPLADFFFLGLGADGLREAAALLALGVAHLLARRDHGVDLGEDDLLFILGQEEDVLGAEEEPLLARDLAVEPEGRVSA